MTLNRKAARRASQVSVAPGGALQVLERIWFDQESRYLVPDDVRDAVMLVAPVDGLDPTETHGFRSQDAVRPGLELGSGWDMDAIGFNFGFMIPPDIFPDRGRRYRVEFVLTVLGNTPGVATHELRSGYDVVAGSGLC